MSIVIKQRVLVVDDDTGVLAALEAELKDHYDVTPVSSVSQALACLHSIDFSAIISDVRMPGVDGLSLISQCAVRYPNMVRIILTAFDGEDVNAVAMGPGAYKLLKPWGDDLLITLKNALKMRQSNSDLKRHLDFKSELMDLDRRLHTGMNMTELIHRTLQEMMRIPEVRAAAWYSVREGEAPELEDVLFKEQNSADGAPPHMMAMSTLVSNNGTFYYTIPIGEPTTSTECVSVRLASFTGEVLRYLEFIARQSQRTMVLLPRQSRASLPPVMTASALLRSVPAGWILDKLTTPVTVLWSAHQHLKASLDNPQNNGPGDQEVWFSVKQIQEITDDLGTVAKSLFHTLERLKEIKNGSSSPPPAVP